MDRPMTAPTLAEIKFTGWIPIGLAPVEWEGLPVLWRDSQTSPLQIKIIPAGFSRIARHCGDIQVAGVASGNPLSDIPDAFAALAAECDLLRAKLEARAAPPSDAMDIAQSIADRCAGRTGNDCEAGREIVFLESEFLSEVADAITAARAEVEARYKLERVRVAHQS